MGQVACLKNLKLFLEILSNQRYVLSGDSNMRYYSTRVSGVGLSYESFESLLREEVAPRILRRCYFTEKQ